ncbi:MAG: cytochrome c [Anaerolineae bacterium]|nr:MAG: cytochrome c [Anaerolineae bacterium]
MNRLTPVLILLVLVVSACSQGDSVDSLPPGEAGRGEALFTQSINGAPPCSGCHTLDGTALVGPGFQAYGETASTRRTGSTAQDYTYTSIVRPSAYVVDGFSNVMYSQYGQRLSPQQIADLIAYLLTL